MNCRVQFAKEMNRSEVVNNIQNFFHKNTRIPIIYELKRIYSKARMVFGTWNKAIQAAGYEPNPVMFAKHYIANDGHKCDLMAEKIMDDWLYKNHLIHIVHMKYPWNNGMKCDFLIGNTWIEIFGLQGNLKSYDELRKEKLRLIKIHKLKLLTLNLKEVYNNKKLDEKLKKYLC